MSNAFECASSDQAGCLAGAHFRIPKNYRSGGPATTDRFQILNTVGFGHRSINHDTINRFSVECGPNGRSIVKEFQVEITVKIDRKSTRLNSSHIPLSRI